MSILDMEKSTYKGPGVGMSLVCLESSKGSVVAVRRRRKKKRRKWRRRSRRRKGGGREEEH